MEEKVPCKLKYNFMGKIQAGNLNGKYMKNPGLEFPLFIDSLENCADILSYIFAADPKLVLQFI